MDLNWLLHFWKGLIKELSEWIYGLVSSDVWWLIDRFGCKTVLDDKLDKTWFHVWVKIKLYIVTEYKFVFFLLCCLDFIIKLNKNLIKIYRFIWAHVRKQRIPVNQNYLTTVTDSIINVYIERKTISELINSSELRKSHLILAKILKIAHTTNLILDIVNTVVCSRNRS